MKLLSKEKKQKENAQDIIPEVEIVKHYRSKGPKERDITLVAVKESKKDNKWKVGYSIRNPKDKTYRKKFGRMVACGRAMRKPYAIIGKIKESKDLFVAMEEIAEKLKYGPDPRRKKSK